MASTRSKRRTRRAPAPAKASRDNGNGKKGFLPKVLDRTVIAVPLLDQLDDPRRNTRPFDIVIDVNLDFEGGREEAKTKVHAMIDRLVQQRRTGPRTKRVSANVTSEQYVFATLEANAIRELVRMDTK